MKCECILSIMSYQTDRLIMNKIIIAESPQVAATVSLGEPSHATSRVDRMVVESSRRDIVPRPQPCEPTISLQCASQTGLLLDQDLYGPPVSFQ